MFTSTTTSLNPFNSSSNSSSSYVDLSPYIYHHHHHHEPPADHHNNTFLVHQNQNQNQIQNHPLSILPLIDNHSNNTMSSSKHHDHEDYFLHQFGLHNNNNNNNNNNNGGTTSNSVAEKRAPKKDRHSKIYTAQGLRDRRVRMSIEIARKFFDLQDLLGFDKASKTLEWLLNKSKKAIKKLAQSGDHNSTLNHNNNNSSNSTCEEEEEEENVISKKKKKKKKKKKGAVVALSSMQITAKQLREKARARARERTRIKLLSNNNSKFNDSYMMNLYNHHQQPYSFSSPCINYDQNLSSSSKIVGGEVVPYGSISSTIGESILIKRKSMNMGYQQNLFLMKDVSNCSNNFPNLPPINWDNNNNATARSSSTYCAITSMNTSSGVHGHQNGKLWEADQNSTKWL